MEAIKENIIQELSKRIQREEDWKSDHESSSETNMAIRFKEKCVGQKLYLRIEKSLAYLKHLPSLNSVVERILNPTGQKLHL